ncbi:MAG: polyprenol monophosphomannose synthase [Armatimonadetes bacterium]|nr:polyprenol monophosphomannose synthase [Armatimonadota bacterium]
MVSVVIPTYNEKDGIRELVEAIFAQTRGAGIDAEVVIVDDNSPDGTGQAAEDLKLHYPVQVVHRAGKLGLSSAVIDGWKAARGEIVGVMDADLSHDPAAIPALVRAIENDGCQLAVGSRYTSGGGIKQWPLARLIISKTAVWMASPLTPIRDITSGYFFVRREVVDGVQLNPIGFKIGLETFVKGRYRTFIEVPYTFTNRVAGKSKLGLGEIWLYLVQLADLIRYRLTNGAVERVRVEPSNETPATASTR